MKRRWWRRWQWWREDEQTREREKEIKLQLKTIKDGKNVLFKVNSEL